MAPFLHALFRRLVRIDELWFDPAARQPRGDLVRYRQSPTPIPDVANTEFETIVVDLTQLEPTLWSRVNPKARTKISRAARDGMVVRHGGRELVSAFARDYDVMRRRHGLGPLNTDRLARLAGDDRLVISQAVDASGRAWAWHVWLLNGGRARQLHSVTNASASAEENAIAGRANRLLHWKDFLAFKARGLGVCDLGGVNTRTDDPHAARIAAFKGEFGGAREMSWDALAPLSWKGRLALGLLRLGRRGGEA
jgi:hypothetical protein